MPMNELHRAIRRAYADIVQCQGDTRGAFKECVRLALQVRPEMTEKDARMTVARMIAEEPGQARFISPQPSPS